MRTFKLVILELCPESRFVCGRMEMGKVSAESFEAARAALVRVLDLDGSKVCDLTETEYGAFFEARAVFVQRDGRWFRNGEADTSEYSYAKLADGKGD